MSRPWLIYEKDCGLCGASARWVARRAGDDLDVVAFEDPRVPAALRADRRRAHWVEGGEVRHGGAAITGALRLVGWGWLAVVLDLPVVSRLRDGGYFLVARVHRRGVRRRGQ